MVSISVARANTHHSSLLVREYERFNDSGTSSDGREVRLETRRKVNSTVVGFVYDIGLGESSGRLNKRF